MTTSVAYEPPGLLPAIKAVVTAAEVIGGPDDFGGTDEGSHYESQTSAAKILEFLNSGTK